MGRPTALTFAPRLSSVWGVDVWLKREDLAHTGAHKINNAIGQALLVRRLGARRIVAETGAGQHGVATAAACARLGLPCTVYMGAIDMERQAPNVGRMRLLGARVVPVEIGDQELRFGVIEARDLLPPTHEVGGLCLVPSPLGFVENDNMIVGCARCSDAFITEVMNVLNERLDQLFYHPFSFTVADAR